MQATLIHYKLKPAPCKQKEKFRRGFLGYTDKSNKGQYTYRRMGVLDNIPHLKPGKQTLIIPTTLAQKILKTLKKHAQIIQTYPITIAKKHLITKI